MPTIRDYSPTDFAKTIRLFEQFPDMFEDKEVELIKHGLEKDFFKVFVQLSEQNQLIGCICLSKPLDSDEIIEITALVVDQNHLHQGLGTRLLEYAQTLLKDNTPIRDVFVTTADYPHPLSQAAIAFYKKNGFSVVGQIPNYWGPGDDKIFFYKKLSTS